MNKHTRAKKILFALVLSIAISANIADASIINNGKNISANDTFRSDNINTPNYKFLKSKIKGQVTGFASTTPTLDSIKPRVETYMNSPVMHELTKIPDGGLSPANAVTLVINGEDYYYIPGTNEDTGFLQLMATYANTLVKETEDASKAIYSYGGKMYTYDTEKLPLSVYRVDNGTSGDYNYVTYTKQTNGPQTQSYYLVKLQPSQMKIEGIDWTQKDDDSGYTWPDYTPASSVPKFTPTSGDLTSVEGAVRFNLPYKSGDTKTQYYKYEYNIPTTYTRQASKVTNDDVNNKYFYNLNGSAAGIAVELKSGVHSIKADFINNRTTGSGTIATTTNVSVSKIEGNFIKNTAKEGGCMHIQGGHIKEIIGNFVGNSVSGNSQEKSNGGALNIWSGAVVDSIHGVFVGNTAANNSGAINNGGQTTASTIKVITGDFIANSALKGNGGAILNEKTTGGTDSKISKIYAITGDYIGNAAKGNADNTGRGGAIYNRGLIYDVIGDYIGNAAEGVTTKTTTGLGGAIYNDNSMRYITGDYVGNSATNDGGAIYNSGNITSVTADFIGNRVTNGKGAGIYNSGTMALVAETKNMLFYDNKDNTKYNDIYQKNGTIAINAAETHNIIFNGTIEGENGTININNGTEENINGNYEFNNAISGNNIAIFNGAKIKLDKITQTDNSVTYGVFNLSGQTFKNDENGGLIDAINQHIDNQDLGNVSLSSDLNFKIDMNLSTPETDTITANYSGANRNIVLSDINLVGTKSWSDFADADIETKIKILNSNSDSLKLKLSDDLINTFENAKVRLNTEARETSRDYEAIAALTKWDKDYKTTIHEDRDYGIWKLAKSTTENDSLEFNQVVRNESREISSGDTLYLVNKDTTNATKNFTANIDGATYTLTKDLDDDSASTKGTLNIKGIEGNDTETLNLNNHTGFILADSDSKLNFNNITVGDTSEGKTPATTTIATITNGSATVGLNNAILNGNINSDVNYNLSIAGTSIVNGTLNNSNTTFNGTELTFNTDTFSNATLNVVAGSINAYDSQFRNYTIGKLVSDSNARYNIDISWDNDELKADSFHVGSESSGTIYLGGLTVDFPTDDTERIVRIIYANNDNIQLAYDSSQIITEAKAVMTSNDILAAGFGICTSAGGTTNDSIKVRGLQDTFKAWANYQTEANKQFTFVSGAEYTIPNSFNFDANNKAAIINNGTVTNNGTLSNLALTNNDIFTNNGTITGISLANSGTFTNNSSTLSVKSGSNTGLINGTGTLNIASGGTYTNTGTINNNISNAGTLTSAADKLGGTISNSGILNLSGELAKAVSGNSGTTMVNGTLSLNTGASVAGTLNMNNGTVTISGGSTPTTTSHNIGKIVGNGNLNIDMNLAEQSSDKINLAKASSGTLTINSVNIIDSTTTQIDKNFSVQVLNTNPDVENSIQLALSEAVQSQFASHEYISDYEGESTTTDPVLATTPWAQDFYETHTTTERTEYSKLGLSDDKRSITITERREDGGAHFDTSLGDTLTVVNQDTTLANKSFKTTNASDVYTVKEELGVTRGNVIVEGVVDSTGESVIRSTIDFNSKNGFVLDENNASVTLKNVEIKNASNLIGGIAENNVKVVLDNVNIHDNNTGIMTSGNVEIKGNSTIADKILVQGASSKIDIDGTDTVTLNSSMTGTGASNKLNISNGTVNLGNNTSITGLNTTFNNTTINLANESSLNGLNTTFNGTNSLNMANNSTDTLALGNINLNGILKMQVDADLANARMDQISATSATVGSGGRIDVSKINLMSPTTEKQLDLLFTDNSTLAGIVNYTGEGQIVYSPIYKYNTSYVQKGDGKGYFSFASAGSSPSDFNPAVMAASVTTIVTGYQNQMQALHQGFYHMDRYMKHSDSYRFAAENQNKIASLAPVTNLDINRVPETSQAMWVIPYTTFERVNLSGGVSVDNISYGMTYGGDSDMFDMGHGFKGVISGFIGYNGNHMTYNGVSMTQNGGFLGATLNAYRGNFFTGLTVSTGASAGDADTMYGHDNITLLTAGIANKTGYNFEFLKGKIILQPALFLGYSWVNTFDYTNSAGVKIKQDALNALQIAPGIKLIGNTKNGWQPYAGIDMVWNIFMGRNRATANDVVLPKLSERAYVQYGVGIQKTWADRFTGFLQAMVRNGGRNGIVLSAGFRWTLGKNNKKTKHNTSKPGHKAVIKSLK